MSFGTQIETDEVMSTINMTPMVDVMLVLVLLIVFIITVSVMKHAIHIDLPRAPNQAQEIKTQTVLLSVDAQGIYYSNEAKVTDELLPDFLKAEAAKDPQLQLHIRGDKPVGRINTRAKHRTFQGPQVGGH